MFSVVHLCFTEDVSILALVPGKVSGVNTYSALNLPKTRYF